MVDKIISDLEAAPTITSDMLLPVENGAGTFAGSVGDISNFTTDKIEGVTSTATAAGTTTLNASSTPVQIFTGATTQTVVLPNATTLRNGKKFTVINQSTGTVTVNYNGGTLASLVNSGGLVEFRLVSNATTIGTWALSSNGIETQLNFLSSGTWTKQSGLKYVKVWTLGGGGGSGGAQPGANMGNASGGGGGGGCAYKMINAAALGATETVTIGAGGTAGTTTGAGGAGGTSSFGSQCSATGGAGSINASGTNGTFSGGGGGAGGVGTGGNNNLVGNGGQNGSRSYSVTGLGGTGGAGAGAFGGGGAVQSHVSTNTGVVGVAAAANTGGGASGASADYNAGTARAGAAGGSGIVVVMEYY